MYYNGWILPAIIIPAENRALAMYQSTTHTSNSYTFLRLPRGTYQWKEYDAFYDHELDIKYAIIGGNADHLLYFGRTEIDGRKYYGTADHCYRHVEFEPEDNGKLGLEYEIYEVLVGNTRISYNN